MAAVLSLASSIIAVLQVLERLSDSFELYEIYQAADLEDLACKSKSPDVHNFFIRFDSWVESFILRGI